MIQNFLEWSEKVRTRINDETIMLCLTFYDSFGWEPGWRFTACSTVLKLLGDPMGGSGEGVSVFWAAGNWKWQDKLILVWPIVLFKVPFVFLCFFWSEYQRKLFVKAWFEVGITFCARGLKLWLSSVFRNAENDARMIREDQKWFSNSFLMSNKYEKAIPNSTSLSCGNQVDGSPPARRTEAVGGPHGGLGLAPIHTLDLRKLEIDRNNDSTLPERFVGVSDCIFGLLLNWI